MHNDHVNVLAMIKGEEKYVFLYSEENRIEMLRTLGRYAADPELSFSWYDAAIMSKKIRELAMEDGLIEADADMVPVIPKKQIQPRFLFSHEEDVIE
jgi:hypothetical protein